MKMQPLSRHEIIEQLNRLGITKPVERAVFMEDYITYFNQKDVSSIGEFFYKLRDFFFKRR
ncbi:MAG: hypothetical protein JSV11_08700 [Nitrospiraceae bacterium]|nr:MAG: hypothetical protein JSV11_08700 [Nitrospiraceae bacterium]